MDAENLNILEEMQKIIYALNNLDEDSFEEKFPLLKQKMCEIHNIIERTYYLYSEEDQKKISETSKQIKNAFDNLLRKWIDRVQEVKNELDLQMVKKKLLSYKRC